MIQTRPDFEREVLNHSIAHRFTQQVQKWPEKVAAKTRHGQLTYRELNNYANGVAQRIVDSLDRRYALSEAEQTRYTRQMLIEGWGLEAQETLKASSVFVAGAGGSGSPLITQLALLGIGTIIIADDDCVELSNLNRQFLHDDSRIGMNKAESAALTVKQLNPNVHVIVHPVRITAANVEELVGNAAIIFDNIDDLGAKFLLSEVAVKRGIPQIISSMIDLNSYVAIFHTPYTPCFHCLYDRSKLSEMADIRQFMQGEKKAPNPVASPALFVSTGFACNEAVKILLGIGTPAYNKYFLFNQKATREIVNTNGYLAITYPFSEHFKRLCEKQGFDWREGWRGQYLEELTIAHDPACPVCGKHASYGYREQVREAVATGGVELLPQVQRHQQVVALLFEQDTDMLAGIFGALKSGSIYLPLDPAYPEDRLSYMLQDAGARLIITNDRNLAYARRLVKRVGGYVKIVNISTVSQEKVWADLDLVANPDQVAYILYTSGSTGQPKGVYQSHRNLLHFLRCYTNNLQITAQDRLTLFSSYSFDAAIMDIYGALLNGATLYPYSLKEDGSLQGLAEWMQTEQITIYHSIPSVFRYFAGTLTGAESFRALRFIVMGGEALFKKDVEMYQQYFPAQTVLVNGLGPTESTVTLQNFIAHHTEIDNIAVPVGYPVEETEVFLLDEEGREVGLFGTGEMIFKSPYLALGYWQKPEDTARAFGPDPRTGEGRIYRSGDLGKLLMDGKIEFAGRKDFQVKVRGYRIELSEVEVVLNSVEGLQQSAVIAREAEAGEHYLIAYYVARIAGDTTLERRVREALKSQLPEYMLPAYYVELQQLPLTPTGKVNRKALQDLDGPTRSEQEYVAPTNSVEAGLAAIWSEVLAVEQVGITDNFFDRGGHSLKGISMISKVAKAFQVEIPLREIFARPTIKELAEYIRRAERRSFAEIAKVPEAPYYPVSSAQKRLYILNQLEEGSLGYNMPRAMVVESELDAARLEMALRALISRHESLRTSFKLVEGEPVQIVHQEVAFAVKQERAQGAERAAALIHSFVRPFDLSTAPLLRVGLICTPAEQILLFDMHHIISDGTSMGILVKELIALYEGQIPAELTIQYKDFAAWQNQLFASEVMKREEEYWLTTFAGEIPVLDLPADYPRPAVMDFHGDAYRFVVNERAGLQQLAAQTGTTLYMVLLAAYTVLLQKYTGQEDIIVGTPVAGRPHTDLEHIIGMFVNTLALRNQPVSEKSFLTFLAEVKANALAAFENQDYPFEMLIEKLKIERDLSRNPLFDTMFTLQNTSSGEAKVQTTLELRPYGYENRTAKFDLELIVVEAGDELICNIEYSTRLFAPATITRMARHFIAILQQVLAGPERALKAIDILSAEEKAEIIYGFNDNRADFSRDRSAYQLFEEHAAHTPERIALRFAGKEMTYRELNERANQLARVLRRAGVADDQLAGVLLDRSPLMVECILAVWKAGGAYIPMDLNYPVKRVAGILQDSGARVLLTNSAAVDEELRDAFAGTIVELDLSEASIRREKSTNLELPQNMGNLAYVIYTSGSTGKPKGAMVEHIGMMNHMQAKINDLQLTDACIVAQNASHCFDISVWQFFIALVVGGKTFIYPNDLTMDPAGFIKQVVADQVTILEVVPSFLSALLEVLEQEHCPLAQIDYLLVTGETVKPKLVKRWFALYPEIPVVNAYGPTEASDDITHYIMESEPARETVPIGKSIQNFNIYIVDKDMQLCPVGVKGEICVAGIGVGRGYLNDPVKTANAFMEDPFAEEKGVRLYKTGDLGRWLPDGTIEFFGRKDYQVKIRGFRIEMGEIESRLMNHSEIREAVVVDRDDRSGNKYLCAYLVASGELTVPAVKEYLLEKLPDYMVPAYFVFLDKLPLNPNGKVDRKALPRVDASEVGREYVAPTNPLEERLALIWAELLERERVSIDDDFFELSGHSLKATSLISRIYREFQIQWPLREVFKYATVRKQAEQLGRVQEYLETQEEPVALLNAEQTAKVFAFPPITGYGIVYKEMAGFVDTHALYSFDFVESDDRLERYVQLMRKIQPEGPYTLLGYSSGGNLAFEVVKKLEEQGQQVRDLIMLDAKRKEQAIMAEYSEADIDQWLTLKAEQIPFLREYLSIEAIKREVITKILSYMVYDDQLVNTGTIHTNLHYLKAPDTSENAWERMICGTVRDYAAAGLHEAMLDEGNLEVNAQIVREILAGLR